MGSVSILLPVSCAQLPRERGSFLVSTASTRLQFTWCVTLPSMPESPARDRRTKRTALSREARRLADEMESLYIQLEQIGALATIRQYMTTHSEESPRLDLLQTAKALRCYAGVLSLIAASQPAAKNHQ
jgi:hypothetical protein